MPSQPGVSCPAARVSLASPICPATLILWLYGCGGVGDDSFTVLVLSAGLVPRDVAGGHSLAASRFVRDLSRYAAHYVYVYSALHHPVGLVMCLCTSGGVYGDGHDRRRTTVRAARPAAGLRADRRRHRRADRAGRAGTGRAAAGRGRPRRALRRGADDGPPGDTGAAGARPGDRRDRQRNLRGGKLSPRKVRRMPAKQRLPPTLA